MLGQLHHPLATADGDRPAGRVQRGRGSEHDGALVRHPQPRAVAGVESGVGQERVGSRAEADEADGLPVPGGRARRVERAEQRDGHPAARHAGERRRQDDVARRRGRVRRGAPGRAGADVEPLAARHALGADHDADDRAVAVPDRRGHELAVRALVLDREAGGRLERGPVRTGHHGHVGHPGAGLRGQHVGAVGLEGVEVDRAVGADDGRHAPQRGLGDPQRRLERGGRGPERLVPLRLRDVVLAEPDEQPRQQGPDQQEQEDHEDQRPPGRTGEAGGRRGRDRFGHRPSLPPCAAAQGA